MQFKTLRDLDVRGKRVLLREDLNVPMNQGAVADFTRIDAALPTMRYLHENGARTIVLSHLGRPNGTPNPKYSLRPVAQALQARLGVPVGFAPDCMGPAAQDASAALRDGDIVLLENVRFHPEAERNDAALAKELALLGELYINDAFGTAHRAHASTAGIPHDLHGPAGFFM